MDINDLRGLITAVIFVAFVGIWIWAWSSKRKRDFHEASHMPLNEPDYPRDDSVDNRKEGDTP